MPLSYYNVPERDTSSQPLLVRVKQSDIDAHRTDWANRSKEFGWHRKFTPVLFWVSADGYIDDSFSVQGQDKDDFILLEADESGELCESSRQIIVEVIA